MHFTSRQKTFASWTLLAAGLACFIWLLAPVLLPFLIAAVLAYALSPAVQSLAAFWRGRVPRMGAVLVVEAVFLLVVLSLVLMIIPIVAKELPLMRTQLPILFDRMHAAVTPYLVQWGWQGALDVGTLKALVMQYFSANGEAVWGSVWSSVRMGGGVAMLVIGYAILIPVALFYFLCEWPKLIAQLRALVPPRFLPATQGFLQESNAVLGQYLRGQLAVMVILAVYYTVGLSIFGLDMALPIGVLTGLAIFIPYVGFGVGLLLATTAGLLEFTVTTGVVYPLVMVSVVYGLGQIIEGFILTPRLVGERIGLHPLAVIFALLAFGQLFGFVGVLIALPVSAVALVALRRAKAQYVGSRLYRG